MQEEWGSKSLVKGHFKLFKNQEIRGNFLLSKSSTFPVKERREQPYSGKDDAQGRRFPKKWNTWGLYLFSKKNLGFVFVSWNTWGLYLCPEILRICFLFLEIPEVCICLVSPYLLFEFPPRPQPQSIIPLSLLIHKASLLNSSCEYYNSLNFLGWITFLLCQKESHNIHWNKTYINTELLPLSNDTLVVSQSASEKKKTICSKNLLLYPLWIRWPVSKSHWNITLHHLQLLFLPT